MIARLSLLPLLFALMTIGALADPTPSPQTAITNTLSACLGRDGIARYQIVVIRIDGNAAQVRYRVGDAGTAITYLAHNSQSGWVCLGGTGGVPSPSFYSRVSSELQAHHVQRSPNEVRELLEGKRGRVVPHAAGVIVTPTVKPR